MPATPDLASTEEKARRLLDSRIESVRQLVAARQKVAALRNELAQAEHDDAAAYGRALKDGWSPEELRTVGLPESDKRARARRLGTRRSNASPTTATTAATTAPPASVSTPPA